MEVALAIGCDVVMAVTLPMHFRIIYVLVSKKYSGIHLDPSFHTIMINSSALSIIFSAVFLFIQEPASSGLFLEFFESIGYALSKVVQIQSTLLMSFGTLSHLLLGITRLTAIALPLQHASANIQPSIQIWTARRLRYFYIFLWTLLILAAIPLLLPGSTAAVVNKNVYDTFGVEFALLGDYYAIYAIGTTGIAVVVEFLNFLCYIAMCLKVRSFMKLRSNTNGTQKIKRGVIRTTIAALIISIGSWMTVAFFIYLFSNIFSTGKSPFTKLEFSLYFRLLNANNNVLTAWVLIFTFSKVRRAVMGSAVASGASPASVGQSTQPRDNGNPATTAPSTNHNMGRF